MGKFLTFGVAERLRTIYSFTDAPRIAAMPDQQMDKVAAGFDFEEIDVNNAGITGVFVNKGPIVSAAPTFLSISGTPYPSGVRSFQLFAIFGP
jgi:hypothetical protein